nr:D-serine dehydratase [Raoultella sp. NCTC 9187]
MRKKLALEAGLLTTADDYSRLLTPEFKQFFSQYSIAVGSTGNLGMSIGIMSARIGLRSPCICPPTPGRGKKRSCAATA